MKIPARQSRLVLLGWLLACFVFSAITEVGVLLAAIAAVALVFARQAVPAAKRALVTVAPLTAAILALTWANARWILNTTPDLQVFASLALRSLLLAFLTFAVLGTVDLLGALAPWPTLSRLLVVTLAQIHALRLLVRESWLGLQSRLPRRPGVRDALGNAGGLTTTLLTLSTRNAREISDAMRSRGF